MRKASNKHYKK